MFDTDDPRVTVALPVWNEERHLAQTIESILNQSFRGFTLLIADNNSTDRSFSIATAYAELDPRIRMVRHLANGGAPANFRYCLHFSQSQYFTWLGAHDRLTPDYLEAAVGVLDANPGVVLVYPRSREIDVVGRVLGEEDSPIHTTGLSPSERVKLVANGLKSYTCFYGLYRRECLQRLPLHDFVDADRVLLASLAAFGDLVQLETVGIERRSMGAETEAARLARYVSIGLDTKHGLLPYQSAAALVGFVLRSAPIALAARVVLALELTHTAPHRYGRTWRGLLADRFPFLRALRVALRGAGEFHTSSVHMDRH